MKLKACIAFLLLQVSWMNLASAASSFVLEDATIDSFHSALKNKQITCEQFVAAYIARIKEYNLSNNPKPPINAITEINPSVLDEARALDESYAKTQVFRGSLHCVPVLLKDNIGSSDSGMTSGSFALLGTQPIHDAFIVSELRKAGAIILAHTAMDEFAFGVVGISSRSGRVGNAYDTTQNSGGSSAGSGAGVSANFGLVGIGTDNSGSVRIPAAFNGIFGLRPSTGLISQHGVFPMGNLDGTVGPMTRTVKDMALLLDVIAQPDPNDPKTQTIPRIKSYTAFLNENGLKGKRIGIVRLVGKFNPYKEMPNETLTTLQQSWKKMHELGATIVDNILLPQFDNNRKDNMAGTIEDVNMYLSSYPATRKNFRDICESGRTTTFGSPTDCIKFIDSIPKKSSATYKKVLQLFQKNKRYIEKIMTDNHLDALFMPISQLGVATYDMKYINAFQGSVSSNAGLPSISINIGYSNKTNMPMGIELIAKQFNEPTLIEIAYAYEQHIPPRTKPIMPSANNQYSAYSIAELNHLYTLIGQDAYLSALKNKRAHEETNHALTPSKFEKIILGRVGEK
jgi:aspartyl-tRNA(Asn)/glutamyl-tRNA(Gln) amidotransferase subunit A